MAAPPYQKLFWGSYHKHTAHLTHAREHGAYLLLIGALWNNGGRLPSDDETLASYAKISLKEWATIKPKLMRLFHISRGKLTQRRVTEDLAKYRDTSGKRKEAGKTGGIATAEKQKRNRPAIAPVLPTKPEPESEPKKEEERAGSQVLPFPAAGAPQDGLAARPRGSRLKPDWQPSADNVAYAVKEGFTLAEIERMAEAFRDYWTAASGAKATKLDWSAAWRTWTRNERDRHARAPPRRQVDWC